MPVETDSAPGQARFHVEAVLKRDHFGCIERGHFSVGVGPSAPAIRRDVRRAPRSCRPLARWLLARERRALEVLDRVEGLPRLLHFESGLLVRSWVEGNPMQAAAPRDPAFYHESLRLLIRLHRRGVTHNDLAKEPNWLVTPTGRPALVDFQLASVHRRRSYWFRLEAREDLRHLLKHKRSYCPQALTPRERAILARPSWPARVWRQTGKRLYLLITRRLLGWADREGAGDRGAISEAERRP